MKRIWIPAIILVILATAAGCKTYPDEGRQVKIKRGEYAPNFSLTDTTGEEVSLWDHRNKVVLINFWATWCPPCLQEMPDIQTRYEIHKQDLSVLAVNDGDSLAQVSSFQHELGLSFNPLLDPNGSVSSLYQVSAFPTSIFLDEHGIIRFIHIGLMTASQLDAYLLEMGLD
ncbi:MAG: redoxin domain-containing protein [Anaerolineales bacterium]|nr:redoxin domain-containing protein [Anaerolineales bacterium]